MKSVSVVVPTCNRPQDLRECLDSILSSSYPVQEVLVMDQGNNGAGREVVESLNSSKVRYFHLDTRGKSKALNLALQKFNGDILCFTDDDCLPTPDWVKAIVEEFEGDAKLSAVYGQTLAKTVAADAKEYATFISPKRRVYNMRRNPYNVGGAGGNMAYGREALKKIGFFDEALGPGAPFKAVEDNEYFYRTFKLGLKALYSPKVIVYHKQHMDKFEVAKRMREYRLGDGAFIGKYLLKLDPLPLTFYLMLEAKRIKDAMLSRDLPYLRHIARRLKFTILGIADYIRWRFKGAVIPEIQTQAK